MIVREREGYFIILCVALAFSLYPSGSRLAYDHGANPTFLILVTTFLRTASLIGAARVRGITFRDIWNGVSASVGSGFFQAVTIVGVIVSLRYIPGPVMITIVFTHTLMLLGILYIRGEAKPSNLAVASSIVALIGIALVVDVLNNLSGCDWRGLLPALIAAVGSASRLYVYGKQLEYVAPETVGARSYIVASFCVLGLLLLETPRVPYSIPGWVGVILACASLMVGTVGFFTALKALGAFKTSLMLKCEPVLTSFFSWLILGETLNAHQYVGVALVLGSLVAYQVRE